MCKAIYIPQSSPARHPKPPFIPRTRPILPHPQTHQARDNAGKQPYLGAKGPNKAPKRPQPLDRHPLPRGSHLALYKQVDNGYRDSIQFHCPLPCSDAAPLSNLLGQYRFSLRLWHARCIIMARVKKSSPKVSQQVFFPKLRLFSQTIHNCQ